MHGCVSVSDYSHITFYDNQHKGPFTTRMITIKRFKNTLIILSPHHNDNNTEEQYRWNHWWMIATLTGNQNPPETEGHFNLKRPIANLLIMLIINIMLLFLDVDRNIVTVSYCSRCEWDCSYSCLPNWIDMFAGSAYRYLRHYINGNKLMFNWI